MNYGKAPDWRGSSLLNPSVAANGGGGSAFGTGSNTASLGGGGGGGYRSFADDFALSRDQGPRNQQNVSEVRIQQLETAVNHLEKDNELVKNAIAILEGDRNNLRQAIRKLKVENSRMRLKCKRMASALKGETSAEGLDFDDDDIEYSDIKEFILVGGPKDPFSLRFEASIKDVEDKEHKSAERYLWYKMAETFGDMEAAEKIRTAVGGAKAEEEMGKIKGFDEQAWNQVKMKHWEDGQRMKVEQVRWIQNLLIFSDNNYIAVASQDKTWGTGWRKQRQEAAQPRMWDGENLGGKALMRMRTQLKADHSWIGPNEENETEKKFTELKRTYWRREMPKRDFDGGFGGGRGGGGGGRGGSFGGGRGGGGGGFPMKRRRGGIY